MIETLVSYLHSASTVTEKRKIAGGVVGLIGFMLSPLSWWNDLFVNVPLALGFAWLISWFEPSLFAASFILGYWGTNVLGLILMQKGAGWMLGQESKGYDRKSLLTDLAISLVYT